MKKDSSRMYEVIFAICVVALVLMLYSFFSNKEKIPNPYIAKEQGLKIPKEDLKRETKMLDFLKQVKEPMIPQKEQEQPIQDFHPDKGNVGGNKK